jgi:hypothetical protein
MKVLSQAGSVPNVLDEQSQSSLALKSLAAWGKFGRNNSDLFANDTSRLFCHNSDLDFVTRVTTEAGKCWDNSISFRLKQIPDRTLTAFTSCFSGSFLSLYPAKTEC